MKIYGKTYQKLLNLLKYHLGMEKMERAKQKTEVKICYDDKNIYFGVIMYDNSPDSILKELSLRDEENKNFDVFSIFINPFNDGQMEYNICSNSCRSTNR